VDTKTRGHSWKIAKNRRKLDIWKYFFSERVVNRWNSLSQEDVDQRSINGFKTALERRRKERWTSSWTNCLPSPSGYIYFSELM